MEVKVKIDCDIDKFYDVIVKSTLDDVNRVLKTDKKELKEGFEYEKKYDKKNSEKIKIKKLIKNKCYESITTRNGVDYSLLYRFETNENGNYVIFSQGDSLNTKYSKLKEFLFKRSAKSTIYSIVDYIKSI